jgi:hypothetical protein
MLSVRSGLVRIAAVGVAGVGCLTATACGGVTATSLSAAPSASSTVDPLAGVSASKVVAEAQADAEAAPSLTLDGTVTQQGQNDTIDVGIKRGQGCTGTVGLAGQGTVKLTVIGKTIYMNPDKQFWTANAGSSANAVIALVSGRYIKVPSSDKNVASVADLCDVSKLIDPGSTHTYTKGAVTTLDGRRVLAINGSNGGTGYVTDTSKPEYVEVTAPKGDKNGSGKVVISVDAPVTLAAPPASEVIDGTTLGM